MRLELRVDRITTASLHARPTRPDLDPAMASFIRSIEQNAHLGQSLIVLNIRPVNYKSDYVDRTKRR